MEKVLYSRVQTKRGAETLWKANNPILKNGEIIIVDTLGGKIRLKVGDGVTAYNDLPFANCSFTEGITLTQAES